MWVTTPLFWLDVTAETNKLIRKTFTKLINKVWCLLFVNMIKVFLQKSRSATVWRKDALKRFIWHKHYRVCVDWTERAKNAVKSQKPALVFVKSQLTEWSCLRSSVYIFIPSLCFLLLSVVTFDASCGWCSALRHALHPSSLDAALLVHTVMKFMKMLQRCEDGPLAQLSACRPAEAFECLLTLLR